VYTFAEAMIACIGTGTAVLGDVNWLAGGVSGCVVREEFSSLFF